MTTSTDIAATMIDTICSAIEHGHYKNLGHDINRGGAKGAYVRAGEHYSETAPVHPGVEIMVTVPDVQADANPWAKTMTVATDAVKLVRESAYKQGLTRASLPAGGFWEADLQDIPANGVNLRLSSNRPDGNPVNVIATFATPEAMQTFRAAREAMKVDVAQQGRAVLPR